MTALTADRRLAGHRLVEPSRLDRALLGLAHVLESYVARRARHDRCGVRIIPETDHSDRRACAVAGGAIGIIPR